MNVSTQKYRCSAANAKLNKIIPTISPTANLNKLVQSFLVYTIIILYMIIIYASSAVCDVFFVLFPYMRSLLTTP